MAGGKGHKAQQARAVSADFVSSVTGPAPPGPVASAGAPAQLHAPPSSAFKQVEIQIVQLLRAYQETVVAAAADGASAVSAAAALHAMHSPARRPPPAPSRSRRLPLPR